MKAIDMLEIAIHIAVLAGRESPSPRENLKARKAAWKKVRAARVELEALIVEAIRTQAAAE
jgi:hypothetical protein